MSLSDNSVATALLEKIESNRALVGVIGLGYVGLPLVLSLTRAGFPVLGFDTDQEKVEQLAEGRCYIPHIDVAEVARAIESGLQTTSSPERLVEPDVLLICVPTPLSHSREPDLQFVVATVEAIAKTLRPGQLVVLESTTYPGTSTEVVLPRLTAGGLELGVEVFVAYAPEREDPGNSQANATDVPRIVGSEDPVSGDLAEALYEQISMRVVRVSSTGVAEAAKITENVFRSVNIALVNELKVIYDRLGIDIWEVLDAAETKPFGFMRFNPGPGWGGHCIPVDPFYLSWKASQIGTEARFVELAGTVNIETPDYVVAKLEEALEPRGEHLAGSRILLLGISYKKNIGDTRESPAFVLMKSLTARGAAVEYHDPFVPEIPPTRAWPEFSGRRSTDLSPGVLRAFDAVIVVTDHEVLDWEMIAGAARILVDTRGVYRDSAANLIKA